MRKTFRLMTFALAATFLTFTACNPNDDDENNPSTPPVEQPELSYTFEDVEAATVAEKPDYAFPSLDEVDQVMFG